MTVEEYQREFIDFLVRAGALTFGDFLTKSGRRTPFFIDLGRIQSGGQQARLARFYAEALSARLGRGFDVLFGPAYKGIPLVVATAMVLARDFGHDAAYCFNRKEEKDHGEGGNLVGHRPRDGERVVILEDVITAGTSVRESIPLLRAAARVELAGLLVSVDRLERGHGLRSALSEVQEEFRMPAFAIATIDDVVAHLSSHPIDGRLVLDEPLLARLRAYRELHGAG